MWASKMAMPEVYVFLETYGSSCNGEENQYSAEDTFYHAVKHFGIKMNWSNSGFPQLLIFFYEKLRKWLFKAADEDILYIP